jgi:hypothetical protein
VNGKGEPDLNDTKVSRAELVRQLQELGADKVTAAYDGCGDSGQIESPNFWGVEIAHDLVTAVEALFYDYLEELYGGWELNEGSYGIFEWDLRADKISLAHTMRMDETEEREL